MTSPPTDPDARPEPDTDAVPGVPGDPTARIPPRNDKAATTTTSRATEEAASAAAAAARRVRAEAAASGEERRRRRRRDHLEAEARWTRDREAETRRSQR